MVHDCIRGSGFMGIASKLQARAVGLIGLGILLLTATVAGADPAADSRLMFDPGALDRSRLGSERDLPQRAPAKPADERPAQAGEQVWIPNNLKLPNFEDRLSVGNSLAEGLSATKSRAAPAGANLFEQRVTLGTLSIGLETETNIKQRSLSGDGEKDPDRDAILDPKRQRGFLPFIGLSAKSSLQ
jgi:hypothetical protein